MTTPIKLKLVGLSTTLMLLGLPQVALAMKKAG
jgi:hypothetical protein